MQTVCGTGSTLLVSLVVLGSSSWQRFILWGESRSFWNSSDPGPPQRLDPLRTWCHGSKGGIGQWAELYTVWSLISNLNWRRLAVKHKLPLWFTQTENSELYLKLPDNPKSCFVVQPSECCGAVVMVLRSLTDCCCDVDSDEYFRMKLQWKSVSEEQERRNSRLRDNRSLIGETLSFHLSSAAGN